MSVKKASQLNSLYVVAGDEPFLVQDALDQLRQLSAGRGGDWERHEPDGAGLGSHLEEWLSPSMFNEPRGLHLVLAHKAFRDVTDALKAFVDNPVKDQLVVVEIRDFQKRDRNTLKLSWVAKSLSPAGQVIDATSLYDSPPPWKRNPQPWDSELAEWIRQRAHTRHGLKIAPRDLTLLVDRCGNDPGRLAGELDKLALYLHPAKEVTTEALEELVPDLKDATLEALSNDLRKLDVKALLHQLHDAQVSGLDAGNRRLLRPEEQIPVMLKVFQNTVENLIQSHRFRARHPDHKVEDLEVLDRLLGLERIHVASLKERLRNDWLEASRRVRLETLLHWQKRIQDARRSSRQGGPVDQIVFSLVTEMLEKRLIPAATGSSVKLR